MSPLRVRFLGPKAFCFVDIFVDLYLATHSNDPIRRYILMSVSCSLICSKNLEVSTLHFLNNSQMRAVAVND